MTSSVSICSNALLQLGDDPISSFDEENDRTTLVANLYADKLAKVLRLNDWSCATKRVTLSPLTTTPDFDWAYEFLLPSDWIRTISVGLENAQDDYKPEGRKILMDRNVCYLRYIWRNEDESTWDSLLIEAMTQVMIAALTYPITKSTTKQRSEEEIVRDVLASARAVDAQGKPTERLGDSPLLANRQG